MVSIAAESVRNSWIRSLGGWQQQAILGRACCMYEHLEGDKNYCLIFEVLPSFTVKVHVIMIVII